METKLEAELQKEKEAEDAKFEKRKAKMISEMKAQFEANLKDWENLSKANKDKLLKEHQYSLN